MTDESKLDDEAINGLSEDVFDDSETKEEIKVEEEKGEAEEKSEESKEEAGKLEESEEKEETPSSEQKTSVPMAALQDERRKRQAAEARLKELEQKDDVPDPVSDPKGYAKHVKDGASADSFDLTIKLSRDLMMDAHKDYSDMEKVFMELVSEEDADGNLRVTDPKLYNKFKSSANPAKFAYNHAKSHQDFLERSSPEYEAKLRKEIEQEVLKKFKGLSAADLPNLNNTVASDKNTEQPESDDDPDDGVWD